jgi:small subunit ribosomal protein S4
VNRPAYQVRPQDTISINPGSPVEALMRDAISLGFRIPEWLAADHEALSGFVLHQPQRGEVDVPADENRVVEFIAKF